MQRRAWIITLKDWEISYHERTETSCCVLWSPRLGRNPAFGFVQCGTRRARPCAPNNYFLLARGSLGSTSGDRICRMHVIFWKIGVLLNVNWQIFRKIYEKSTFELGSVTNRKIRLFLINIAGITGVVFRGKLWWDFSRYPLVILTFSKFCELLLSTACEKQICPYRYRTIHWQQTFNILLRLAD